MALSITRLPNLFVVTNYSELDVRWHNGSYAYVTSTGMHYVLINGAWVQINKFGGESNYSSFESDGTLVMTGDATVYDDLRVEPVTRGASANLPAFAQWFTNGSGSSGVYLYNFTNVVVAQEKEIFFTMQMPHSWDGSAISMHVHWLPSAAEASAAVRWGLEYNWAEIGANFGNTTIVYSAAKLPNDTNLVQYRHYVTDFDDLTPSADQNGISSVLIGRIFRNSSNAADTFTGTAGLLYIDAHFKINTLGSRSEYTK
jgi:hypothetical protein